MFYTLQDSEVHITYEDQQQINTFARHNAKLQDIKEELVNRKVIPVILSVLALYVCVMY